MPNIQPIVWMFIALVILVFIGLAIYLIFFRKPTREKFALRITGIIVGLFLVVVAIATDKYTLIFNVFIELINQNTALDIASITQKTALSNILIILATYLVTVIALVIIHRNWNSSVKTQRTVEYEKNNIKTSIIADALAELQAIRSGTPLETYDAKQQERQKRPNESLGKINHEKLSWHRNVAYLLPLFDKQYHINDKTAWYSQNRCFVSQYGVDNVRIVIYCPTDEPTDKELQKVYQFIHEQEQTVKKLIIAIEADEQISVDIKNIQATAQLDVKKYYKQQILNSLIDITAYTNYLHNEYYLNSINKATATKLQDIYVAVSGRAEQNHAPTDEPSTEKYAPVTSVESYVLDWVNRDDNNQHLAVLGEYGQGKSVLSLKVALAMLERAQEDKHQRIPIIIELRGQSPRNLSPLQILNIWAVAYDISAKALLRLHKEGRLLLIFEGFDEMDLAVNSELRLDHFRALWQFARDKKAKVMFTGRPNLFLDDTELKKSLNIYQPISADVAHMQAIYLDSLSDEQIEDALRSVNVATKNDILALIRKNNLAQNTFYKLVSRPSMLFMVSCVWNRDKLKQNKERITSAMVIGEFIQAAYERQEEKQYENEDNRYEDEYNQYENEDSKYESTSYKMPLSTAERTYFMMGVAVAMLQKNGDTNYLTSKQLVEFIDILCTECPEIINPSKEQYREPLKERINKNKKQGLESIRNDIQTCGILVRDVTKNNYWKFAHKSYFEYLVSDHYLMSLEPSNDSNRQLSHQFINKNLQVNTNKINYSTTMNTFVAQLLAYQLKQYKDTPTAQQVLAKVLASQKTAYLLAKTVKTPYKAILLLALVSALLSGALTILYGMTVLNKLTSLSMAVVVCVILSVTGVRVRLISGSLAVIVVGAILGSIVVTGSELLLEARELIKVALEVLIKAIVMVVAVILLYTYLFKRDLYKAITQGTLGRKIMIWYLTCIELGISEANMTTLFGEEAVAEIKAHAQKKEKAEG